MGEPSETQSAKITRRQWTIEEDALLVEGLFHLVDAGWKADAGTFKPGYTKEMEKHILKKKPHCTLKANPHIESRVKLLKRQYSAIKEMLGPNASGFGWDDTRKMIVVEREIYKQWCKSHSSAIGLYGKPFPHFDSLDIIYGKDRATGAHAESLADAAFTMMKEFYETEGEPEINLEEAENNFDSQVPQACTGSSRTFDQLTSCFLHEKETAERKNLVASKLREIEGLSNEDIVAAAIVITSNDNLCNCFFTMDTVEMKKVFVTQVLRKNGNGI